MNTKLDYYEQVSSELIRALRRRRSCAEMSRRIGYRSNMVHRWETGRCWPTTTRFLEAYRRLRPRVRPWIEGFFHMTPLWAKHLDPVSPQTVAIFLQHLKGKTSILRIAEITHRNRYSVSRWIEGKAQPKLPDFLRLVDAMSRRLLDLISAFVDPLEVPSLKERWEREQLARKAAYEFPWSHAVLRALELGGIPSGLSRQQAWIAQRLGISVETVTEALTVLEETAQVKRIRTGFVPREVRAVDTSSNPKRAHALKVSWTKTALDRLKANAEGHFGYSLFAISKADLVRLHDLHIEYVRAMQEVIAHSEPSECVGLYCAQLLDLGAPIRDVGNDT